jgi:hypothetical protein
VHRYAAYSPFAWSKLQTARTLMGGALAVLVEDFRTLASYGARGGHRGPSHTR